MCEVMAIGFSHGTVANSARIIISKPTASLKRFILDNRVSNCVMTPTPITAGKVPKPNASMVKLLLLASPAVAARASAEYTSPHGNQPQLNRINIQNYHIRRNIWINLNHEMEK